MIAKRGNLSNKTLTIKINSFTVLSSLVLYMPLHFYICELLLKNTNVDNIFRDIVIIALFIKCFRGIKRNEFIVAFNCAILIVFCFVSVVLDKNINSVNILRTYLMPLLFYYIIKRYQFKKYEFFWLQKAVVVELTIISLYGLFQAFILGDDFVIKLGYPSVNGFLAASSFYIGGFYGFQRNMGTFVSPNTCGLILAIALLVKVFDKNIRFKRESIILVALVVGLIGTYSRSAILGVIVACILLRFVNYNHQNITHKKRRKDKTILLSISISFILLILYFIDKKVLDGLYLRMAKSSFLGTINGTDSSAIKHKADIIEPFWIVLNNPLGLGFGTNGPMAAENLLNGHSVESSLYLMMYEVGIVFGAVFFLPYLKVIVDTIKNKKYKYYVPAAVSAMTLITYLLLPNVQTYEVLLFSMMYVGFYYNPSVKSIYSEVGNVS